jgi:hypothetical protein
MINGELATRQWHLIDRLVERAHASGVTAAVVKGLPLSALLYGHWALRGATDIDFCVPPSAREFFHETLVTEGLIPVTGALGDEGKYRREDGTFSFTVEVHSELLDEPPLLPVRLPLPPPDFVSIEGRSIPVVGGPTLVLFLAMELAAERPLLIRSIDFMTLFASLDDTVRSAARGLARTFRLHRYFDWAVQHADAARGAAAGGGGAIHRLIADRREHASWRLTRLAGSPKDGVFCALEWLWPTRMRRDPAMTAGLLRRRGVKLARFAAGRRDWRVR